MHVDHKFKGGVHGVVHDRCGFESDRIKTTSYANQGDATTASTHRDVRVRGLRSIVRFSTSFRWGLVTSSLES